MLRPVPAAPLLVLLVACSSEPAPSGLQQREVAAEPAAAQPGAATAAPAAPGTPPPSERVEVRLALREGTSYRVTTVGNVRFGTVMQRTGYAREERLTLSQCEGEGHARACALEHRYVNFEAEPPAGPILENDEAQVNGLVTSHKLRATGERPGTTTIVGGPTAQAESAAGKALAEAHRFYCLRFPEEAIGVGAKWRAKCHMRTGGVIDTRDVLWELKKLERDPDTGLRAELTYVGEYTAPGPKGSLQGVVSGMLYFFVDAGEPHLLREEFTLATDAASKFVTHTQVAYQFARLVPGPDGKETAVRVDGKPFPSGPALNEPRPAAPEVEGEAAPAGAGAGAPAAPGG